MFNRIVLNVPGTKSADSIGVRKYYRKGTATELNYCMHVARSSKSIMAKLNRVPENAIDLPKRSTSQN